MLNNLSNLFKIILVYIILSSKASYIYEKDEDSAFNYSWLLVLVFLIIYITNLNLDTNLSSNKIKNISVLVINPIFLLLFIYALSLSINNLDVPSLRNLSIVLLSLMFLLLSLKKTEKVINNMNTDENKKEENKGKLTLVQKFIHILLFSIVGYLILRQIYINIFVMRDKYGIKDGLPLFSFYKYGRDKVTYWNYINKRSPVPSIPYPKEGEPYTSSYWGTGPITNNWIDIHKIREANKHVQSHIYKHNFNLETNNDKAQIAYNLDLKI